MENLSQAAARLQEVKTEERNLSNKIDDFEVSFNDFYMSVNSVKKLTVRIIVSYNSEESSSKIVSSALICYFIMSFCFDQGPTDFKKIKNSFW